MSRLSYLVCLALQVMVWCSCQASIAVLIVVEPPAGAVKLQVLASLDGILADAATDVPLTDGTPFSFVLVLPEGARGRSLQVGIGARNGRGCLVARGVGQTTLSTDRTLVAKINPTLTPLPAPVGCGGELPVLIAVTPATVPAADGSMVRIDAWGVHPQARLRLDGVDLPPVQWRDFGVADTQVPGRSGRAGPAALELQHPDGTAVRSTAVLAYHLSQVSFASAVPIYVFNNGASWPSYAQPLALGDMDGDGLLDVAVVDGTSVNVLINSADGFASAPRTSAVSGSETYYVIAAGDLEQKGRSDVVLFEPGNTLPSPAVRVMRNRGDGRFDAPGQSRYWLGGQAQADLSARLTDLDNDGLIDILVLPRVQALVNTGAANFVHGMASPLQLASGEAGKSAVIDLSGDGLPDLVDISSAGVVIYLNQGSGAFGPPQGPLLADQQPTGVQVADLNRDGLPDLIVQTSAGQLPLLNQGGGSFLAASPPIQVGSDAILADLDDDECPDLIIHTGGVAWLQGLGNGQFAESSVRIPTIQPQRIYFADVNGDGKTDIVSITGVSVSVSLNTSG